MICVAVVGCRFGCCMPSDSPACLIYPTPLIVALSVDSFFCTFSTLSVIILGLIDLLDWGLRITRITLCCVPRSLVPASFCSCPSLPSTGPRRASCNVLARFSYFALILLRTEAFEPTPCLSPFVSDRGACLPALACFGSWVWLPCCCLARCAVAASPISTMTLFQQSIVFFSTTSYYFFSFSLLRACMPTCLRKSKTKRVNTKAESKKAEEPAS